MSIRDNLDISAYLVLGPENTLGRPVGDVVAQALDAGFTCIQVRSKVASAREIIALTGDAAQAIAHAGKTGKVALLIDDRLDCVLAAREHPLVRRAMSGEQITRADLAPFAQLQIRVPLQTKGVTRPLSFEKDEDSVKVFLSTQSFLGPPLLLPGTDLLLVLPRPTAAFWVTGTPG